jgi:hypothetical protein
MRNAVLAVALAFGLLGVAAGGASAAGEPDKYALEAVSAALSTTQAGAHADFTTTFRLTREKGEPYARTRDIEVHLPPGMLGNPQAIPRCTVAQLNNAPSTSECPIDSQVGVTTVSVSEPIPGTFTEPLYNMTPPGGDIVARFGFFAVFYPAFINVRVDPKDYSLVASIEGAPSGAGLLDATTTLWGVPAAESHDKERLTPEEAVAKKFPAGGIKLERPPVPFLSNPTDCGRSRQITVTARSYQLPGSPSEMSAPFPEITGCGNLSFAPTFTAVPTNPEAATPTGLDATLTIPQDETPQGLATSTLKSAVVTLPEGMSINPAAGDGLAACSDEQVGYEEKKPSNCPDAAKIGSVEIEVPALEDTLEGSVYQRTPVPGRLFGFWVVTDEQGVHLKLPAEIQANPLTGQLTTFFTGIPSLGGNPQVPVEELRLHVFGGPRAPLATPSACGTYQTSYSFTPWSGKPASEGQTGMQISSGCNKTSFSPGLTAGTTMSFAGHFAPFSFTLTRVDGEPNPSTIAVHLPQGLLAKLGGVPLCSDAEAAAGTCSAASQVGTIAAAAGVGGAPLWLPQPGKAPTAAYLAGPYKGAPYSIVSVVPAQAGPFDLGTVVNRAAIEVDPATALATVKTDPLPQILEGVPVSYRAIHVDVDRPHFTLNPTSCAKKRIRATVSAVGGRTAEASDGFQATNCAKLPYTPKLKLSFKGSTKRTGNPAVTAVLTQRANQANTSSATVILPPTEFIDNSHINNPCTRVQFGQDNCPKKSILGHAEARTPLLDQPLRGPVYFRSNGGERELPDLVADLRGPIHIILVGFIDSVQKKGAETSRLRTRFANVPDAPVTKFRMNLFGGKRGLIENNSSLCHAGNKAKVVFKAQNGRLNRSASAIAIRGCGKGR